MSIVEVTAMLGVCASLSFFAFICKPVEPETSDLELVDRPAV